MEERLMTDYMIPIIVLFIILYGFYKNVDLYESFLKGVKEGMHMVIKIFPTIFTMMIAVQVLINSNIVKDFTSILEPVLKFLKFPSELLTLAILRPISGTSSLVVMNDLLKVYGPDSYIGRVASIIQGSTDTTIYILGLYFSTFGIKKTKYALIAGLLADLSAIILSIVMVRIFF